MFIRCLFNLFHISVLWKVTYIFSWETLQPNVRLLFAFMSSALERKCTGLLSRGRVPTRYDFHSTLARMSSQVITLENYNEGTDLVHS